MHLNEVCLAFLSGKTCYMGTVDVYFSHVINNDGNFETMSVRLEDVLQQGSLSTSLLLCQSLSN